MFEKFCFCYKHRAAAILLAVASLIVGVLGTITFSFRVQYHAQRTDEDYLIFSVFHLLISVILISALIWEQPVLIFCYLIVHIAILTAFFTHTVIYMPFGKLIWLHVIVLCFVLYCMYCIYLYYNQIKLKRRTNENDRYVDAVYYINNNTMY
ncbi:uncharacterized protein LOC108910855 [Anoplophora glabripennis]|uniref:uncharacterized protein LOC108910855 n=1 Tax=Anoplophora glabripennis TaxID=217634 RepID=UPI0008759933|nr:uncharacterized protein LOC108910855 [Anoplophora glabripennis]